MANMHMVDQMVEQIGVALGPEEEAVHTGREAGSRGLGGKDVLGDVLEDEEEGVPGGKPRSIFG